MQITVSFSSFDETTVPCSTRAKRILSCSPIKRIDSNISKCKSGHNLLAFLFSKLEAKYMSINPLRDCCLRISKTRRERGDLFKRRDTARIEDSMRASEGRSLFSYGLSSTFGEHQTRYQMHL